MSSIILQNPYTARLSAILSGIWGIIKDVAQAAANNLDKVRTYHTRLNYEYTTSDGGAANPLGLLHPQCRDRGVGMPSKTTLPGYVYLIHAVGTDRYKIGRSVNLKTRLQQLQRQSPYPLKIVAAFKTSNPAWDEANWQNHYKEYRVYGEWFKFDESFYKNRIEISFWSRYEEFRVADLAIVLAKSQGIDWQSLGQSDPDKNKYFVEASKCLKVEVYSTSTHLEV